MKKVVVWIWLVLALAASVEAATRKAIPGGMFADNLTGGEFAAPAGGAIVTHAGLVPLPPGGVLFARITTVNGFRIAVKAHDTDRALVWDGAAWADTGQISHGTQGHVWTDTGDLFIHAPCADCDSQGIRWWEPGVGPIYGSPTYNPFTLFAIAKNVRLIYEWTCRGDVCAGQGEDSGAVLQYRGKHYVLEPGDARFIQFHRDGDLLAVAVTKFREQEAVLWWLTVGEIEALPPYVVATAPPSVPPPPTPTDPAPSPGPNQKATVERIRAKYPTPLGDRHWAFLVEVAQATGAKLFRKDGGDRVLIPALNLSVSQDILIIAPEWIDILGDAETTATPAWDAHPNAGEPEKWIDVRDVALPGPAPSPVPPPVPAPSGVTRAEMDAAIAAAVSILRAEMQARFDALPPPPPARVAEARVREMIAAAFAEAVITGRTGRDRLGLDHPVGTLRIDWRPK